MVIITDKYSENLVYFPKNTSVSLKNITLTIRSLATLEELEYDVEDESNLADYYLIDFDFDTYPDGEYEYTIGDDRGLLIIGDYKTERQEINEEYKHNEVTYKQYNG